ncbi:MAG: transketolase C-terminal domain-containing protein [Candidatus Micrarchaeia archaeon]
MIPKKFLDFSKRRKAPLTGSRAVAFGVFLSRANFIAAYPITPQTEIVEDLSQLSTLRKKEMEFMKVESEHSAMSSCIGASIAGARAFTATSSQGLEYMHEVVYWAGGARLPIVMVVATRVIAPPWSIQNEHTDFMLQLDNSWIQFFAKDPQEALDSIPIAYKIAEKVNFPVMVGIDGYITTHLTMPVDVPAQEEIDSFLPKRKIKDFWPKSLYAVVDEKYFNTHRYKQFKAFIESSKVIDEVEKEYSKKFGKEYKAIEVKNEGSKNIIVTIGASFGEAEIAAKELTKKGIETGAIRIRRLRPFPEEEIKEATKNSQNIVVVERAFSTGSFNFLAKELRAILGEKVKSFTTGLGGKDITKEIFKKCVKLSLKNERGWVL